MKFQVIRLETCGSTNVAAKDLARSGAAEGTVVVAVEQTAGRGTKGRTWHSSRGRGLYATVLLRPASRCPLSLLPLAAGIAACEAVERAAGLEVKLRWPNDLVWGGRKLGGILCESAFSGPEVDYSVIGLGLNLLHRPADFPEEIRESSVSVREAAGMEIAPEEILGFFLAEVEIRYSAVNEGRADRVLEAFADHSALGLGDPVAVLTDGGVIEGRYYGVGPDGSLRVVTRDGERRFAAAEIVRFFGG
jgi:BirA family biotin operon repressor/biotin-[acetyl-CoA-carboxylase] ligase